MAAARPASAPFIGLDVRALPDQLNSGDILEFIFPDIALRVTHPLQAKIGLPGVRIESVTPLGGTVTITLARDTTRDALLADLVALIPEFYASTLRHQLAAETASAKISAALAIA